MLSAAVLPVVVACRLCALLFSVGVLLLLLLVLLRSLLRVAFEEASSASAAARTGADAAMPKKCRSSKLPLGPRDCWAGCGGAVATCKMAKVSGFRVTGRTRQLLRLSKPSLLKRFAPARTWPSSNRPLRGAQAGKSSVPASCSEPPHEQLPTDRGPSA